MTGGFRLTPVPQANPWLRFHVPLIEPNVRISRIRLSDKDSCVRTRIAARRNPGTHSLFPALWDCHDSLPDPKTPTQGPSEFPEAEEASEEYASHRVWHRYVYDATCLAQRETHAGASRVSWHGAPELTRFIEPYPSGPIVYADSDGTVDVQMTDRFGGRWFMYRARESCSVPADTKDAKLFRHTGHLRPPSLPTWHYQQHPLWYERLLEPDYVLGRRGTHGWDKSPVDMGLRLRNLPEEEQRREQRWTHWAWAVIKGIGIALAVLAATVAVFATAGAILAAGLLAAGVASATVTSVMIGLGIGVGVSLAGVALATSVGGRLGQGQSLGEAIGGGLADLTGISGVYAGITGKDIAAQEDLGLSYEQRGQMFGQGLVQVAATAFGAYKGIRAGIRKFRAWRQARSLQAGPDVEFSGGTKGSGYADISGVTGKTARARNRHIDATIKQHLRGINLTHKARYNPFMESPPGKIRYGAAKRGVGTQVSRHAFRSQRKLTETLVHEELHHRFWRNNLLNHHDDSALNEKFMRIVARYLEMRGW